MTVLTATADSEKGIFCRKSCPVILACKLLDRIKTMDVISLLQIEVVGNKLSSSREKSVAVDSLNSR